jgi:sec-independent protein translocase protein TatA
MFGIGFEELIIILVILLLLFGSKKIPELARGLGESIKELRKGMKEEPTSSSEKSESEKK